MRVGPTHLRVMFGMVVGMLLVACSDETVIDPMSQLVFAVDRSQYAAGDAVAITTTNPTTQPVPYSSFGCASQLERQDGNQLWTEVHHWTACPLVARALGASQTATELLQIPVDAPAGRYRFRMLDTQYATPTFTVRVVPAT